MFFSFGVFTPVMNYLGWRCNSGLKQKICVWKAILYAIAIDFVCEIVCSELNANGCQSEVPLLG